jgi:2'-5' RNA ligase
VTVMQNKSRLFIAALPDLHTQAELQHLSAHLRQKISGRFVPPENYHITLAFLGDTPDERVKAVMGAIRGACKALRAHTIQLGRLGFFGKPQNAVLWCGFEEKAALCAACAALRASLGESGIPYDGKPFRPHVTLARQADISAIRLADIIPRPVHMPVSAIVLFKSERIDGKMVYTPLFTEKIPDH